MSKNRSTTILGAFPSIYRLPVDDAGSRLYRVDNERESIGQVIAWPTVKAHPPILLRAITRKPSCLISCSQSAPEGGCGADVGRHGAIKPAGSVRRRKDMIVL